MNALKFRRPLGILLACLALVALVTLVVGGMAGAQQSTDGTEPGAVLSNVNGEPSFDSATSTGLPPDENPPTTSAIDPGLNQTFSYYQVSGATLRGRSSTTAYAYAGSGCSYVTAGTGTGRILNTELILPDGAIIKFLRVYYNDANAASGVKGYITRYQPGQATADLVNAGSTAAFAGGTGFVVSTELSEVVDNTTYAYTLIGWPDEVSASNQICGLRVAYYAPPSANAPAPASYMPLLKN